jgi:hypothetical protein
MAGLTGSNPYPNCWMGMRSNDRRTASFTTKPISMSMASAVRAICQRSMTRISRGRNRIGILTRASGFRFVFSIPLTMIMFRKPQRQMPEKMVKAKARFRADVLFEKQMISRGESQMECPIFNSDGRVEGDLMGDGTSGTSVPNVTPERSVVSVASLPDSAFVARHPSSVFVDRVAEAEQKRRQGHEVLMRLLPELTKARDVLERREQEVKRWEAIVQQAEAEAARLRNLVERSRRSVMHEDDECGSRKDRLARAEDSLRESREEYFAAVEEMQAAEKQVEALEGTNGR